VGQKGSMGFTFHVFRNVGECEGMNPHPPKVGAHLGVGVPMDSRIFNDQLQGSKPIGLRGSLYHWKVLTT